MKIRNHDIGVCSWSLQAFDLNDLVSKLRELGLQHVHLALAPFLEASEQDCQSASRLLRDANITVTAGMIGYPGEDYASIALIRKTGGFMPDALWDDRRAMTLTAARIAREFGAKMISTHVGFVPASSDPMYAKIASRVAEIADALVEVDSSLLMETGQETASELLQFLNDLHRRNVVVNFDPANMILYGAGDPVDAIRILGRHIRHVHLKDAMLSDQPRMKWGSEVPFGTGQVRPQRFLDALDAAGYTGPLVIEREAGDDRLADIRLAIAALKDAR